jgi:hypothetical protein
MKYLGTTLRDINEVGNKVVDIFKFWKSCYYSVQNPSSNQISKLLKTALHCNYQERCLKTVEAFRWKSSMLLPLCHCPEIQTKTENKSLYTSQFLFNFAPSC